VKFCTSHWRELQDQIKLRGLWEEVEKIAAWLPGDRSAAVAATCPLKRASQLIVQNVIGYCQQHDRAIPDECPVCDLEVDDWLGLAAQEELDSRCASCLRSLPDESIDDELCGLCEHLGGRSRSRPH
jgi:hypothetical protein